MLVAGTDHAGRGDGAPRRRRRGGLLGLLAVDARKLSVVDPLALRLDMVGDFPCRLRMIYAVNLPTLLSPVASFIRACLSKRQKHRLRVSGRCLGWRSLDPCRLPPSLGGSLEFDWAALAEVVVEGGVPE